jgi:hypothetical protein
MTLRRSPFSDAVYDCVIEIAVFCSPAVSYKLVVKTSVGECNDEVVDNMLYSETA